MSIKGLVNTNYFDLNGASLHLNSTQDSTSSTTGCLIVNGGLYVEKNINNHGNIITSGAISSGSITVGTDDSTSTSTGAIVTPGGVGVEKNMYIGQHLHVLSTDNSTSSSTGSLQVNGGIYVNKDVFCDGTIYGTYVGSPTFGTTESTSTSTGALLVPGGAGIGKNLYVGGIIKSTNHTMGTTYSNQSISTVGGIGCAKLLCGNNFIADAIGSLIIQSDSRGPNIYIDGFNLFCTPTSDGDPTISFTYESGNITASSLNSNTSYLGTSYLGATSIQSTTETTSTTTGSLIVHGGVGIAKDVNIGGDLYCDNIISSSNFSTSSISHAVSGNFTGTLTGTVSKCGNTCTIQYNNLSGSGVSVDGILALNALSTSYRPSTNISMPVLVSSNSVHSFGLCVIDTAGTISFYKDAASTGFPTSVTNAIVSGSVSYII